MPIDSGEQNQLLSRYLDTVGDGSGTKEAVGNYTTPDKTFTADNTTEELAIATHGLSDGNGPYRISNSGGALPAGLLADTDYWIINISAGILQLAASYADAVADTPVPVSFTDNGTGTQTLHLPTQFMIKPAAGQVFRIARIIVFIEDTAGFQAEEYGNLGGALTKGITLKERSDSEIFTNFTDGLPIQTNADWGALCYDVDLKTWGAGDEVLLARYTFKAASQYVRLVGDNGERLVIELNDNFSGLLHHHFMVQGYIERTAK